MYCSDDKSLFIKVIEANSTSLYRLLIDSELNSPRVLLYAKILHAYLTCDLEKLNTIEEDLNALTFADKPVLAALLRVRIEIRSGCVSEIALFHLSQHANDQFWQGEVNFVLATALSELNRNSSARDIFIKSYQGLWQLGARKKAVKALHNYVVEESHVRPEKRLFREYLYVSELAIQQGEMSIGGLAFMNVSREYQLIGSPLLALQYCNRALKLLESDKGSLHFFLTLAHRCHLLIDLNRLEEARLDFETTLICEFDEVRAAVSILESKFNSEAPALLSFKRATPTWVERTSQLTAVRLTVAEEKIIQMLSLKSLSKIELIEALYGQQVDFYSAENRVKVLLSRIRKKQPGLIIFDGYSYELSHNLTDLQTIKKIDADRKAK